MYEAARRKRKTSISHRVDCIQRRVIKTAACTFGFTSAIVATAFSIHRGGLAAEARLRCHGFQPSVCGVQNGVLDTVRSDCRRLQSKESLDSLRIYIKVSTHGRNHREIGLTNTAQTMLPNSHTLSTGTDTLLDPSSVQFAIAIMLLPFCAAIMHTFSAIGQARYQQWMAVALPCGAIVGVLLGCKLQEIVFILLPWYWILTTLLFELASIFRSNRIRGEKLEAEVSFDGLKWHDDLRNGRLYIIRPDAPSTSVECPSCSATCSTQRERFAHVLIHRGDEGVVKELCSDIEMFEP